jgi:hypothetical protein
MKEKAATTARAPSNNNKLTTMGFKRMRNGEQRDRETAENEEVVEVETGNRNTTQDQTQTEQRGAARSRPEWMNIYTSRKIRHQHGGQRTWRGCVQSRQGSRQR